MDAGLRSHFLAALDRDLYLAERGLPEEALLGPDTWEEQVVKAWMIDAYRNSFLAYLKIGIVLPDPDEDPFTPQSDCHGFEPPAMRGAHPPFNENGEIPPMSPGVIHCGCRCHLPIGSGFTAERDTCVHCRLLA